MVSIILKISTLVLLSRWAFLESTDDWAPPYLVFLHNGQNTSQKCTGSIIQAQWILTAASCFYDWGTSEVYVSYGAAVKNPSTTNSAGVAEVIRHPHFPQVNWAFLYNVALVKLKNPLVFDSKVNSVELGVEEWPLDHLKNCVFYGFSMTKEFGHFSLRNNSFEQVQRKMTLECDCLTGDLYVLCLKSINEPSTCLGDTGGPLICDGKLVGLLHGHAFCFSPEMDVVNYVEVPLCGLDVINVFAYLCYYNEWIGQIISKNLKDCHDDKMPARKSSTNKCVPFIVGLISMLLWILK